MKQNFDLHLHTSNSDGEYPVTELIEIIKKNRIKIFAITDHDNLDSIFELKKCNLKGLHYLKGVEISSVLDQKYKLHILGYHIDENNGELKTLITQLKQARVTRFYEVVNSLSQNYGFRFDQADLDQIIATANIPSKPHLARLMVKLKYVASVPEAFVKYLDQVKTTTSYRMPVSQVIDVIKKAGGVAVWAHPKKVEVKYHFDFTKLMPHLKRLGLDGIEVYNSLHSWNDCQRYLHYAKQNHLLISGGSDFHGEQVKPGVEMGLLFNSGEKIKINLEEISILKKEKKNSRK